MKGIGLAALIGITLNILWNLKGKRNKIGGKHEDSRIHKA